MNPQIVIGRDLDASRRKNQTRPIGAGEASGHVKWFCPVREFGFVQWPGGRDIYFNLRDLQRAGISRFDIKPGTKIACSYEPNGRRDGIRVTSMRLED